MVTQMAPKPHARPAGGPPEGLGILLSATRFGPLEHVEITGSTNADLITRAGDATDGTVLVADHQTAGRGRLGRGWDAPPETNLLVSVLIHSRWSPDYHPLLTPALAVVIADALAGIGLPAAVKWPNDLVVEEGPAPGKVAGILAEYTAGPPPAVVVGFGLNLAWPTGGDDAPPGATSLRACGYNTDRWDLLGGILTGFDDRIEDLIASGGPDRLRTALLARSATVGRRVRAETSAGSVEGTAVDISTNGSLVIRLEGSSDRSVSVAAGDVSHLTPA